MNKEWHHTHNKEIIENVTKVFGDNLGYEIHTNKQVISIMIDNHSDCCERWGAITSEDEILYYIGASIEGINLIDVDYKTHPLTSVNVNAEFCNSEAGFCFVDLLTSKGTIQFALYNSNGNYGHPVKIVSNQLNHSVTI